MAEVRVWDGEVVKNAAVLRFGAAVHNDRSDVGGASFGNGEREQTRA